MSMAMENTIVMFIVLVGVVVGIVLLVSILLKLNKVLKIWLEQNKKK